MADDNVMRSSLDPSYPPNNSASKKQAASPRPDPPAPTNQIAPRKNSNNPFRKIERIFFDGDIVEATVYTVKNTLRPALMKAFADVLSSWGRRWSYGPNQVPPPDLYSDRASYREDFGAYSRPQPKPKEIVHFSNALLKFSSIEGAREFTHWVKRDFIAEQGKYFTVADALESKEGGKRPYPSSWNDNSYGWTNDVLKNIDQYITLCNDDHYYILLPQPTKIRS